MEEANYCETHWETFSANDLPISAHYVPSNSLLIIHSEPAVEMIRITRDAFYVRGVKVTKNKVEGKKMYRAFKRFLEANGFWEKR